MVPPDCSVHASRAHHTVTGGKERVNGLRVARESISDVSPQTPVEHQEAALSIPTHHLTTSLCTYIHMFGDGTECDKQSTAGNFRRKKLHCLWMILCGQLHYLLLNQQSVFYYTKIPKKFLPQTLSTIMVHIHHVIDNRLCIIEGEREAGRSRERDENMIWTNTQ